MKIKLVILLIAAFGMLQAQDVKIKKGEIQIGMQKVAKIEKQKKGGYKISNLEGDVWLMVNLTKFTQTHKEAEEYWLELTGPNGNLREVEYREISISYSREKAHVRALLHSDTGILTSNGLDKQAIEQFFQSQDRSISEKWDKIITAQIEENEREDQLAKQDRITIDEKTIRRKGERIGYLSLQVHNDDLYTYNFFDANNKKIAEITLYKNENFNRDGLRLKLYNGETLKLNQVDSVIYIDFNDLIKRAVHKLYALGFLQQPEPDSKYDSRGRIRSQLEPK
ncbi:MAG: hypothetical protein LBP34_00280 [Flavobacteriaceae bacterium]|jgi:hypothetical protein|nr:hypothetical protein [Flavobacteriaceae bacterium]